MPVKYPHQQEKTELVLESAQFRHKLITVQCSMGRKSSTKIRFDMKKAKQAMHIFHSASTIQQN